MARLPSKLDDHVADRDVPGSNDKPHCPLTPDVTFVDAPNFVPDVPMCLSDETHAMEDGSSEKW